MPMPPVILRYRLLLGTMCITAVSCLALSVPSEVRAQQQAQDTSPLPTTVTSAPKVALPLPPSSTLQWRELTEAQREILNPLASMWDSLEDTRKKKWLAVAQSYPLRTSAEQKNIQSRMAEWAALPRAERESARLNFTETKKLPSAQRTVEWEAYQKLAPEEKKALAEKGNSRPIGAATPVRPASSPKLTAVPITRHTPVQEKEALQAKPRINPHTLLPLSPLPSTPPATKGATK